MHISPHQPNAPVNNLDTRHKPRVDSSSAIGFTFNTTTQQWAYLLPVLGKLRPQATAGRRLSDAALPAHENPLQRFLLDDILERGIGEILVVVVVVVFRHRFY